MRWTRERKQMNRNKQINRKKSAEPTWGIKVKLKCTDIGVQKQLEKYKQKLVREGHV